jgi:hypothetical protein
VEPEPILSLQTEPISKTMSAFKKRLEQSNNISSSMFLRTNKKKSRKIKIDFTTDFKKY